MNWDRILEFAVGAIGGWYLSSIHTLLKRIALALENEPLDR